MSGRSDGSIIINSKLDNKDFMSNTRELLNAIKSLQNTAQKMGANMSSSASGYSAAIKKDITTAKELRAEITRLTKVAATMRKELSDSGSRSGAKQFLDLRAKIKLLEKEYDVALEKQRKLEITKGINSKAYKDAAANTDRLASRLDVLRQKFASIQTSNREILSYREQEKSVREIESNLRGLRAALKEVDSSTRGITIDTSGLNNAFRAVGATAGKAALKIAKIAGSGALTFLKKLASSASNAAIQLAKLASGTFIKGIRKISDVVKQAASSLFSLSKRNKQTNGGFKQGFTTILKYGFGIRSLYYLFRKLRAAITDSFKELAKHDPKVKAALNSLEIALNGLKGSLATAFSPIFTAIAPALTTFIDMLTNAMNTVGAFFAALTGQKTVSKSIGKISSEAKKATKNVKKLKAELLGFDELNILSDKNDSSNSGSSGKDSGISYKNVPIESGIKDFTDRIKALWEKGDYKGVGEAIAVYINKAIDHAKTLISWESVETKVKNGVNAVAGVFNGLTDPAKGVNFGKIGATVSEGVNTILRSLNMLILAVRWGNVGFALASYFNGLFGKQETWEAINTAITNAISAVEEFAAAFVSSFDEGKLATGILTALGDTATWEGLAKTAWKTIKAAFNKTGNFLNVLFGGDDINEQQSDISRMMRKRPYNVTPEVTINDQVWYDFAENLGKGIKKAFGWLTTKIAGIPVEDTVSAITKWFNDIIENAFGDGSEVGEFLGTALQKVFDGIGAIITNFRDKSGLRGQLIGNAIRTMIQKAFEGNNSPAKMFSDFVIGAFNFVKAFLQGFKPTDVAKELKKAVTEDIDWDGIAKAAWDAFKEAIDALGNFLTVLFGGDLQDQNFNRMLRQRPAGLSNSGNQNTQTGTFGNLAKSLSTALKTGLGGLKDIIESVDWVSVGKDIGEFLANVDWSGLVSSIFDVFVASLSSIIDILSGVDDSLSLKLYGEDYKEDFLWQATHPFKANQYQEEKLQKWREENPEAAAIASKRGETAAEDFVNYVTNDLFGEGKKYENFAEVIGQIAKDYGGLKEENEAAVALAQAAKMVMEQEGITADEAIQRYIEYGVDNNTLILVAAAIGANTDLLEEVKAAEEANTAASESNTTAIDANTTETAQTPELEKPDVLGDLARYAAEKTAEMLQGDVSKQNGGMFEDMPKAPEVEKITDDLDGLPESVQLAIDVIKDGTLPEDVSELLNLTDESNKILQDYLDKHPELYGDSEKQNSSGNFYTRLIDGILGTDLSGNKNGGDTKRSKIGAKEKLKEQAQGDKAVKRSTKQARAQTVETKKLAKVLRKAKDNQLTINHKIDGIETGEDKPTVDVGVKFAPEGEEPTDENTNGGLLGWLETLFGPGISVIAEVFALLTGKDPKSLSIADLFDAVTKVWALLTGKDPKSVTFASIFGSIIEFLAKLTGKDPKTLTIGGLFGTVFGFLGKLTGKDSSGYTTLGGLFGTVLGFLGKLTGKDTSGYTTLGGLFGTVLGFLGKLTGKDSSSLDPNNKGVFGSIASFLGKLTGKDSDSLSPNNTNVFGKVANFLGKLTGKDGESLDPGNKNVFGSVASFLGKITGKSDSSLSLNNKNVFGSIASFLGKITGKDDSSLSLNNKNVFGSVAGFKGKITGKDDSSKSLNDKNVFGSVATFLGKITGKSDKSLSLNNKNVFGSVANFAAAISTTAKKFVGGIQGVVDEYQTDGKNPVKIGGALKNMTGKKVVGDVQGNVDSYQEGDKNKVKIGGALKGVAGKTVVKDVQDNVDSYQSLGSNPVKIAGVAKAKASEIVSDTQLKVDKYQNKSTDNLLGISSKVGTSGSALVSDAQSNVNSSKKNLSLPATVDVQESNIKTAADKLFGVIKTPINTVWRALFNKNLFNAVGGIITNSGKVMRFANGGSIMRNGRASWWNSVNKYASGTMGAHGTVFVAGENGPEIMGHVNGRTEILNKSQLADAMYGAVVSGMAQAVNALGAYIAGHMTTCTNAIVSTIASKADLVVGRLAYYEPAMANGGIMPYDVSAQIARSTQEIKTTLNDNNEDLIQAMVSALGSVGMQIVTAIQQQTLRNGAQNGASAQQVMGAINRQTLMFGTNPLKGV